MKNIIKDKQLVFGSISVIVTLAILIFAVLTSKGQWKTLFGESQETDQKSLGSTNNATDDTSNDFSKILNDANKQLRLQEEVDQSILAELKTGVYTFENPLIIVDPYNISPLTALVVFTTSEPVNISIIVHGHDKYSDISYTFEGFGVNHIIPVYGLYPKVENNVTLSSNSRSGKTDVLQLLIKTEPLPKELEDQKILTDAPFKNKYQPGLNFTYDYGLTIQKTSFDMYGNMRWFLNRTYLPATDYEFGNRYILAMGAAEFGDVLFFETNPLGRIYKIMYAPYGVHHDIEEINGNLIITGSNGKTVEDFIYEIDTKTGRIINSLDMKSIFQRTRQAGLVPADVPDWFHMNAITWVEGTENIIISSRSQSLVAEIGWPHGKIEWMLAPHYGWLPMFDKYLLAPKSEMFDWQFNQHSPEVLPDLDDDPNTMDILLFDNGNQRFEKDVIKKITDAENPEGFSRMVQFRINPQEMTVEQIWQFGQEYGDYFYSPSHGDADLLPNGNRLGVFDIAESAPGENKQNGTFFEVTDQSQIVWSGQTYSLNANGNQSEYRLERMNIYNSDANNLEIGMPVINLIPQEIFDKYAINK